MRRGLLHGIALVTAPGAACLLGAWCAQLEVRRHWRAGCRTEAVDLAVASAVAPLFLAWVVFQVPVLWPYALASSLFHLRFVCKPKALGGWASLPWRIGTQAAALDG